jgi:hypothetical protein
MKLYGFFITPGNYSGNLGRKSIGEKEDKEFKETGITFVKDYYTYAGFWFVNTHFLNIKESSRKRRYNYGPQISKNPKSFAKTKGESLEEVSKDFGDYMNKKIKANIMFNKFLDFISKRSI